MNQVAYTRTINNDFDELEKIQSFITELGKNHNIGTKNISHIQLALEELIVNIISYAYEDQKTHQIQLKVELSQNKLILCLSNQGKAFNPVTYKSTNTHTNLRERTLGGVGVLLARNLVDDMSYSYQNDTNQLTLIKNLI